jgi:hypothetical protein
MAFFTKKIVDSEMLIEIEERRSRCESFLKKIELKMEELCTDALPELKELYASDDDPYRRNYGMMVSAIQGQLSQMLKKATDTLEEKVENFIREYIDKTTFGSAEWKIFYGLRQECSERKQAFEKAYFYWRDKINKRAVRDLEGEYREILEEYESNRDSFTCKQCGATIALEKIYFIPVYLICTHCNTQNTFKPSTKARGLEQLGRELAEQRTLYLLKDYEKSVQCGNKDAPKLYEVYLRAMFDEWNLIVSDLSEQNDKFYHRLLNDFKKNF